MASALKAASPDATFLNDMSDPTGGRTFRVKKTPVAKIFETIEEEMRSQYAIGYISTNQEHDGSLPQAAGESASERVEGRSPKRLLREGLKNPFLVSRFSFSAFHRSPPAALAPSP